MSKKEIYFMGLLANTDSSILKLDLDKEFKIESMNQDDCVNHISILENLPYNEVERKLFMDYRCLNSSDKKIYFVSSSFEGNIENKSAAFLTDVGVFDTNLVQDYLRPIIRLMRLFKEGNICMPLMYYYFIDNTSQKSLIRKGTGIYIHPKPLYKLENSEIPDLETFIQNTKLPFNKSFLNLAFENFELSYETQFINLSFLSLMICLETLFNPSDGELRYRISRNTAVLLGKDYDESKLIFSDIKKLYDKRSGIVHTGKSNIINNDDLLKLRYYVTQV